MSLKRVLVFSLCILVLSGLVGCRETEITDKSELVIRWGKSTGNIAGISSVS